MIRFCIWLLERSLRVDLAEYVIGDLIEEQERGPLWMLGETISALWHLHARPHPHGELARSVLADLRVAARLLRRSPAFTLVSVLTLGLAIGATTAIFSVIEPVLLKPLPYPNAEQSMMVWERKRMTRATTSALRPFATSSSSRERSSVLPSLASGSRRYRIMVSRSACAAIACHGRISERWACSPLWGATFSRARIFRETTRW